MKRIVPEPMNSSRRRWKPSQPSGSESKQVTRCRDGVAVEGDAQFGRLGRARPLEGSIWTKSAAGTARATRVRQPPGPSRSIRPSSRRMATMWAGVAFGAGCCATPISARVEREQDRKEGRQ